MSGEIEPTVRLEAFKHQGESLITRLDQPIHAAEKTVHGLYEYNKITVHNSARQLAENGGSLLKARSVPNDMIQHWVSNLIPEHGPVWAAMVNHMRREA